MTITRIISALLVAAVIGGLLVAGWYLFGQLTVNGSDYVLKYGIRNGFGIFVVAFIGWTAGLLVFGALFWLWLHKRGKTDWPHAVILGGLFGFIVCFALLTNGFQLLPAGSGNFSAGDNVGATWINGRLTAHGWWSCFVASLIFAASAVPVSLSLWWVAYRAGRKVA